MPYDDHVEDVYGRILDAENTPRQISAKIKRVRIEFDPPHDIFNVEIQSGSGVWRHTAGSEADVRMFIEGLRAGVAIMRGHLQVSDIPARPADTVDPNPPPQ